MLKTRSALAMDHKVNGHRDLKGTENERNGDEWRHPEPKKSPMHKSGCNVIEISSSSETEEEMTLQSPSPNGLENGSEGDGKSPTDCWAQSPNMLRRDYGKKTPYRIFQVPASPKASMAGKEEFYKYLGIYSKPPSSKAVDMSPECLKRRSLRVCFIKKWKEHRAKLNELEKKSEGKPEKTPEADTAAGESPLSPTDPNGTIMERRNYIQITCSASDEESEVKHKVCDLSHQPSDEATAKGTSITDKTAKRVRDKSRKRKRIHKKIFKTTYSIRSNVKKVLRSGKVRDTNFLKRLQKCYKKSKKVSVSPKPATKDTIKSPEVIILTDDEDAVEIVQPAETPPPKVTNAALEKVIGVHLRWPSLVMLQQESVSFWTCSEVMSLFTGEQNWQKVGDIKRSSQDVDIAAAIGKRIFHTDTYGCVYVELRGKLLQKIASQETDCTATYVNVHYLKGGEGVKQSIPLDRVCSSPREMCYTTLPDTLSIFVTWYEHATTTKRRTGTCRYSLTPDLETFAKIWDFCAVEHPVRSVSVASEKRVIGVGDQHVSIWNYTNGNLLTSIDLTPLNLGDNLFTFLVQESKERFLLLAQLHANTINFVAINLMDFQYFILSTHENVNLAIDAMRSSTVMNGVFVGAFEGGEILLLKALSSNECVRRKKVERRKNIFISDEHVVEISEKITIRSLLDFLA